MRFFRVALVISISFLTSCESNRFHQVTAPNSTDIHLYVEEFQKYYPVNLRTGRDYVLAGYSYVDEHCENLFIALEMRKRGVDFTKTTSSSAIAQSVAILTYFSEPNAVAIVNAGGTLIREVLESFDKNFNYAPYSVQLRRLTLEAQASYKDQVGERSNEVIDLTGDFSSDFSVLLASHQIVQGYARLCSPAQFELFVETALNKSNVTNNPAASGAARNRNSGSNIDSAAPINSSATGRKKSPISIPPFVAY